MTDPNTPAPDGAQPTPPPPAYGEYASTPAASTPPAYEQSAYQQPAYNAAPAYDPSAGYAAAPGTPVPGKTLGIVAFVLSFFMQPVALVLGIVALVQSKKAKAKNGFALAAIIISSVLIVVAIIVIILVVALFSAAGVPDLITQVEACLEDPSGTVVYQGVTMSCQEVLDQSGY